MTSLRRTAFIWFSVLLLLIGIVTTLTSYMQVTRESDELLDNQLRQLAHYIGQALPPDLQPVPYNPSFEAEENFVVQIWVPGQPQERSSNLSADIPQQVRNGFADIKTSNHAWRTFTDTDPRRTVQVSQRLDVRHELSADAALRAAIPIVILIPLCWLLLGLVIDRLSRRLDRLAANVAKRQVTSKEPIAVEDVPRELAPFIHAINDLLARLQASMERQRRFVSDAAHELRTPLAALKLQVGNVRSIATTRSLRERLDEVDQGVSRASTLVQQLLKLARYDAEASPTPRESTNLALLVRECVAAIAPLAESRGTSLQVRDADLPDIDATAGELKVLISNLLDNAVRHSPEGGEIDIEMEAESGTIVLRIRDDGPGIPAAQLERVFERFYRVAGQEVEGSGLGLAIARSIAERHHLGLSLRNREDRRGIIAELRIPASPESGHAV
jgi:two-component system, OmpR family, sensor kinase